MRYIFIAVVLQPAIGGRVFDPPLATVLHICVGVGVLLHAVLTVVLQPTVGLGVANGAAMAMRMGCIGHASPRCLHVGQDVASWN